MITIEIDNSFIASEPLKKIAIGYLKALIELTRGNVKKKMGYRHSSRLVKDRFTDEDVVQSLLESHEGDFYEEFYFSNMQTGNALSHRIETQTLDGRIELIKSINSWVLFVGFFMHISEDTMSTFYFEFDFEDPDFLDIISSEILNEFQSINEI